MREEENEERKKKRERERETVIREKSILDSTRYFPYCTTMAFPLNHL